MAAKSSKARNARAAVTALAAVVAAGCSMSTTRFDQPDWSIADAEATPATAKSYDNRSGANAPKSLTYADDAKSADNGHQATVVDSPGDAHQVVVAPGDTLSVIGRRHGVSVKALMQANNLTNDRIVIGQSLNVPSRQ